MRWLVLLSLCFAIYRAYSGLRSQKQFSKTDDRVRFLTTTIVHIQFTLGLWLYFISPVVDYFLKNFSSGVHLREIRFFGMEHITMMTAAVILLTIGSVKVKRADDSQKKFKTMLTWYFIVLMIIFLSIPWLFSPFTSRPLFRIF
jgi:cytochrome c biogenesis factor